MNSLIKYISYTILSFTICSGYGQQTDVVLENINNHYSSLKNYSIDVTYTMYRGYKGNDVTESYKGSLYKKGEITSMQVLHSEIWIFPNVQITLDTPNKRVYYTTSKTDGIQNSPIDTKTFSRFYKENSSETKEGILRYEMILKNNKIPSPYNKIVLYLDEETHQLVKQELYFTDKLPFVDSQGAHISDYGRLEIQFNENEEQSKQVLQLADILSIKDTTIQLASRFKSYTLIDQTKHN